MGREFGIGGQSALHAAYSFADGSVARAIARRSKLAERQPAPATRKPWEHVPSAVSVAHGESLPLLPFVHEQIGRHDHAKSLPHLSQQIDEALSVGVLAIDGAPLVVLGRHVMPAGGERGW